MHAARDSYQKGSTGPHAESIHDYRGNGIALGPAGHYARGLWRATGDGSPSSRFQPERCAAHSNPHTPSDRAIYRRAHRSGRPNGCSNGFAHPW
jgi:hypothetical protein